MYDLIIVRILEDWGSVYRFEIAYPSGHGPNQPLMAFGSVGSGCQLFIKDFRPTSNLWHEMMVGLQLLKESGTCTAFTIFDGPEEREEDLSKVTDRVMNWDHQRTGILAHLAPLNGSYVKIFQVDYPATNIESFSKRPLSSLWTEREYMWRPSESGTPTAGAAYRLRIMKPSLGAPLASPLKSDKTLTGGQGKGKGKDLRGG